MQHIFYYACHAGEFLSLYGLCLRLVQLAIKTQLYIIELRVHIFMEQRNLWIGSNTTDAVPGDHIFLKKHGACMFVTYVLF